MKLLLFFAFGAVLNCLSVIFEKKKHIYANNLPTSNFKRKATEWAKEENSFYTILSIAVIDMFVLWLFGYFLFR